MINRLGNVIYWIACFLSLAMLINGVIQIYNRNYFDRFDSNPPLPAWEEALLFLGIALGIWVIGWGFRYVLSGSKSVMP